MLCLYDNAGEHFQPGQDTASSPVTRHLAQSRAILFLFDPTQDPRFRPSAAARTPARREAGIDRRAVKKHSQRGRRADPPACGTFARQQVRSSGVVVVLSKFDEWSHLLGPLENGNPWKRRRGHDRDRRGARGAAVRRLRQILSQYCPETVAAAETFASKVTYIAVSSLGKRTQQIQKPGRHRSGRRKSSPTG